MADESATLYTVPYHVYVLFVGVCEARLSRIILKVCQQFNLYT